MSDPRAFIFGLFTILGVLLLTGLLRTAGWL